MTPTGEAMISKTKTTTSTELREEAAHLTEQAHR